MSDPSPSMATALVRSQHALHLTQNTLARLLGCSRRTMIRWQAGRGVPAPWRLHDLARAVYPVDVDLAGQIAIAGGTTLVELGLVAEPPVVSLPLPQPSPSARHLVDSILCAAADAMAMPPQTIRPALAAAFERATALGMSASDVNAVLNGVENTPAPAQS